MYLKGIHVLLRELSLILLNELTPIIHQKNYKTLYKTKRLLGATINQPLTIQYKFITREQYVGDSAIEFSTYVIIP